MEVLYLSNITAEMFFNASINTKLDVSLRNEIIIPRDT